MKKILTVFLIAALILTMAACGTTDRQSANEKTGSEQTPAQDKQSASENKKAEIRMQIAWASDSGRGKAIREVLDAFEKQNPNVKVSMIGTSQHNQKLLTQILSGDAPEVLQIADSEATPLAADNMLVDLNDKLGSEKGNYSPKLWASCTIDNKLYGFPWLGHSLQLVYNKTLFDKAGIKEAPKTWDELYETAKKLTVDTNGDGKPDQFGIGLPGKQHHDVAHWVNIFMAQAGAKLFIDDGKGGLKIGLNSPEGKKALEFYTKLVKETAPPDTVNKDGGAVMADFRNQLTAMEYQGPWGLTDIWKSGNKFEVSAAEVPSGPAGPLTEVAIYVLSIPNTVKDEKLEAAVSLIKFLGSKEGQDMILKGEKGDDGKYYPFRVPIRNDLLDMPTFKQHPEFQVFIEGFENPGFTYGPKWVRVKEEIYMSILNQVIAGSMSVEEGLKVIEERGNAILSQN